MRLIMDNIGCGTDHPAVLCHIRLKRGMPMELRLEARDLAKAEFTPNEVQSILSADEGEQVRMLIQGRGRLLSAIHEKQRALDQLDFFIHHLRRSTEE